MSMFALNSTIQRGLSIAMRGVKAIMTYGDYVITGDVDPDCTGVYYYVGLWYMKPYYRRADGAWYLWFDTIGGTFQWIISTHWGAWGQLFWYRDSYEIRGIYEPYDYVEGNPLVSEV